MSNQVNDLNTLQKRIRGNWIQRGVDRLFGFDFFISYAHEDGTKYPTALADELAKREFRVFLDTRVYRIGENLKHATPRRVLMSRYLILVARPNALESDWVLREIQACLDSDRIPIVIDINGTYRDASDAQKVKSILGGNARLFQPETMSLENGQADGEPSNQTIERIVGAFEGARQETLRIRTLRATVILLASLLLLAGILGYTTYWQLLEANRNLALSLVRQAETAISEGRTNEALVLAAESLNTSENALARTIVVENPIYPRLPSFRFEVEVNSICFFPDGHNIAVGLNNGQIWICDLFSGERERLPDKHDGWVDGLSVNLDCNRIVSSNFGQELWLWDLEQTPPSKKSIELPTDFPEHHIFNPEFAPNGSFLAANWPEGTGLWNCNDGSFIGNISMGKDRDSPGTFESFSPRGNRIVISENLGFSQYTPSTNATSDVWKHPNTEIATISSGSTTSTYSFNRDGSRLAVGTFGQSVLVFDTTDATSSGKLVREFIPAATDFQVVSNEMVGVGFSFDGRKLVAASNFGSIAVWEARDPWSWSGATLRTVLRVPDEVTINDMKTSPFIPIVAAACSDGQLRIWDFSGRRDQMRIPMHHFLRQTETESDTLAPLQASYVTQATQVIFHPNDNTLLAACADGSVQQINRKTGAIQKITPSNLEQLETHGHNGRTREIVFCIDDSHLLTLGESESLSFQGEDWQPDPKVPLRDSLVCSATSRSGKWLAIALLDHTFEIWEVKKKPYEVHGPFSLPEGWSCYEIAISENCQTVALILQNSNQFQLQTWSLQNKEFNLVVSPQEDRLDGVVFCSDNSLAFESSGEIQFWNHFSDHYEFESKINNVSAPIDVSPDKLWLAANGGDDVIQIYEIESGKRLADFQGHTGQIEGIHFSPDGKSLVSWSFDDTVRLWSLQGLFSTPKELQKVISRNTGWQFMEGELVQSAVPKTSTPKQQATLLSLKNEKNVITKKRQQERSSKSWSEWWNEKYPEGFQQLQHLKSLAEK